MNALYSVGRLPHLVDFAAELEETLGWRPAYWITQPDLEAGVAQRFPDAIRHDFTDANRGLRDPVPEAGRPAVDAGGFIASGALFAQGLDIVSRHVLGNALTHDQKVDFLLHRFEYAMGVVQALDLEVFVLNSSPHCPADFAFYAAFRLLGRKVRILHLTGFRGLSVVLPGPEDVPLGLRDPAAAGQVALSPEGMAEMRRLAAAEADDAPWYVEVQQERDRKHERLYRVADALLAEGRHRPGEVDFDAPAMRAVEPAEAGGAKSSDARGILARLRPPGRAEAAAPAEAPAFGRTFKPEHDRPMPRALAWRPDGFGAPQITWRQYYTYRDWVLLDKRRRLRRYEALTAGFDLEAATAQPFAFYAMHYQPERTTCPEGGWFSHQLATLRMISRSLPEGWRLLVKEHPSQFLWQTEGELGRWEGYHDAMAGIPRVVLVPLDVSAKRLIREARAVVTITGTVGWEACLIGVPAITLARPWYDAEGVTLRARSAAELAQAFASIENGWKPSEDALAAHLAGIERIGRPAYMNPSHMPLHAGMSEAENLRNLVDLFVSSELSTGEDRCASSP